VNLSFSLSFAVNRMRSSHGARLSGSASGACRAGSHSLGLGPSLHRLLHGLRRFVRRFPSYYGLVDSRLRASSLRLLASRCGPPASFADGQTRTSQVPTRSSARDVAFDPGRAQCLHNGTSHWVTFGSKTTSARRIRYFEAQSTPHAAAVYASRPRRAGLAQHSLPGGSLHPTWWTFTS